MVLLVNEAAGLSQGVVHFHQIAGGIISILDEDVPPDISRQPKRQAIYGPIWAAFYFDPLPSRCVMDGDEACTVALEA